MLPPTSHPPTPAFNPCPVTLAGRYARLEPLAPGHAADLFAASRGGDFWHFMPRPPFASLEDTAAWIRSTQAAVDTGQEVVFAVVSVADSRAVGSTRYLDIRRSDRALEIGWTWLAAAAQRTALNTECKLLLFEHAFETLGAIRVQLKTDGRNQRSQRAIERLGAVREGVLRQNRVNWDGYVRDTVYYSILAAEWPTTKQRLYARLSLPQK